MREMLDKKKWLCPLSAVEGLEKYYLESYKCPENCIEIEKENEDGWKNKVYIPKNLVTP